MAGRVIQGRMRPAFMGPAIQRHATPSAAGKPVASIGPPTRIGPPSPTGSVAQQRPGAVAMRHGGQGESFAVTDAVLRTNGPGKVLPDALRAQMEGAMRTDFSAVRIHVGQQAQSIGAIAFTTGNDLYFAPGQYQPDTPAGRELIGHELAHVVQQRQGRVHNPFGGGVAVVQNNALEAEADAMARRALAWRPPVAQAGALQPKRVGPPVRTLQLKRVGPPSRATIQRMMGAPGPPGGGHGAVCPTCLDPTCHFGSKCFNGKRSKYSTHQYGGKRRDQKRLSQKYSKPVSGDTHQAEHPFGFAVLRGDIDGTRGEGKVMREIEQTAPAYQEHHQSHRDHIGTGSSNSRGFSGLNSSEYREWTGQALEAHNPDDAMAINLMDYAHMDRSGANPIELRQADDSFNLMARNMGQIPMGQGGQIVMLPAPTDAQRLNMLIDRWTINNRRQPTRLDAYNIAEANGLTATWYAQYGFL